MNFVLANASRHGRVPCRLEGSVLIQGAYFGLHELVGSKGKIVTNIIVPVPMLGV